MSADKAFIDTNILVYLYFGGDELKKQRAINALDEFDAIISTQVLNEFCNVGIKKLRLPISAIQLSIDEILSTCDLAIIREQTIKQALALMENNSVSYYDSLMLSSAIECECKYMLTEDLSNGQIVGHVIIKNIFIE
jgi:predicted nucleic acid-binding protein